MSVNREQAQMLATLATACRPNGAPGWDAPGVMAEIGKVRERALADVILAVIRAADDRTANTPGVIGASGSAHWTERGDRSTVREPFDQSSFCGTCGKPETRCQTTRVADDDHPFESVLSMRRRRASEDLDTARVVDELRGLVVDAKAEPEPAPERPAPPTNVHAEQARKALAKESA